MRRQSSLGRKQGARAARLNRCCIVTNSLAMSLVQPAPKHQTGPDQEYYLRLKIGPGGKNRFEGRFFILVHCWRKALLAAACRGS